MNADSPADDGGTRPPRRKRYAGKNPRRFAEKYKELAPEIYPQTIDKVLAAGKTPAGSHVPVMVREVLDALQLAPGMTGVDATLGYGGHARQILEHIVPGGFLLGMDADPVELPRTVARLRAAGHGLDRFAAVRSNFAGIAKALDAHHPGPVDFVFADLGCSSMQFDDPARGFSFKHDGPLDMRMNPGHGIPAREWLLRIQPDALAAALAEYADEPRARELAATLAGKSFATTRALREAVARAAGNLTPEAQESTLRRVFQAIRIAVNDELGALDSLLRVAPQCLKPGGRLVILTFHSGEDRRVKKALQAGFQLGTWSIISDGAIPASPQERHANPRSAPAKLRWAKMAYPAASSA